MLPRLCALDQHVSKQNVVHSDLVSCYLFHHQVHDFCRRYFTIFSVKLFSEEMPCYPNKQSDLQRFSGPCSSLKIVLPEISHPFPVSWDFGWMKLPFPFQLQDKACIAELLLSESRIALHRDGQRAKWRQAENWKETGIWQEDIPFGQLSRDRQEYRQRWCWLLSQCHPERFLHQFSVQGIPIACNLQVLCVPALIITPNDQRIVINNQNQRDLWLPIGISAGQKVASSFTKSPPELRLTKDKMGKWVIPFIFSILFLIYFSHTCNRCSLIWILGGIFILPLKSLVKFSHLHQQSQQDCITAWNVNPALSFSQASKLDCQDIPQPLNFTQSTSPRTACTHLALTPGVPEPHQHSQICVLPLL